MKQFNIQLPKEVLTPGKHEQINFKVLEGKVIVGLMGYAKSGKDFITKTFIDEYGYHRIAFADNLKKEMNQYLKQLVYDDVMNDCEPLYWSVLGINQASDIDFFTENLELKKILRPYIIWYGEKLRTINGKFCWINRVFEEDAFYHDKLVLSDVRRMSELDIFRNSNEFKKRLKYNMVEAGVPFDSSNETNNYGTLLFEVSQYGLTDLDPLTIETIQAANEQWIVDDVFRVDSRIPEGKNYRTKAMTLQIKRMAKKFGIEKRSVIIGNQTTIFQTPGVL